MREIIERGREIDWREFELSEAQNPRYRATLPMASVQSTYRDGGSYYLKRAEGERETFTLNKWDDDLTFAELREGRRTHDERSTGSRYLREWCEGDTYAEIAERHGVSIGTIKTQIHRAKKQIRTEKIEESFSRPVSTKSDLFRDYVYGAEQRADASRGSIDYRKEPGMAEIGKRVLLAGEIARILRISRRRVYELLETKQLRGVRVGNRWLVPAAEIDRFLSNDGTEQVGAAA
jgi:excisionase family DNA binding protein